MYDTESLQQYINENRDRLLDHLKNNRDVERVDLDMKSVLNKEDLFERQRLLFIDVMVWMCNT